ncbi:MAG: hypothetical protein ACW986_11375 [Promethearchaeota archaeon]|jgi:Ras-related protein Rab-18
MGVPEQLPDFNIKIILADLGKNEVLQKEFKDNFGRDYQLLLGIDIFEKNITFENGLNGNLSIWDVSAENIFEEVKGLYGKEENITLIAFDLTKLTTFDQWNKYLSRIRQFNIKEYPYVLIGNNSSFLKEHRFFVYSDDTKKFAENEGCVYLEASTETSSDVDKTFNLLAKIIMDSKVPV